MRDILPDASINISDSTPREFLDRMADLADKADCLKAQKNYDSILSMDVLSFVHEGSPHEGLLGQLIYIPKNGSMICVEVRANWGKPENRPSYDTYVEALNLIFLDLIRKYNKTYGTRYRLAIQGKDATKPKLSPKTQEKFDTFVTLANRNSLHPLDWERFYEFARACHVFRTKTNEENVFRLLVHAGFDEEYALKIATVYGHLREFQRYI